MIIQEWLDYLTVKKCLEICLFVSAEYTNVMDRQRQTDRQTLCNSTGHAYRVTTLQTMWNSLTVRGTRHVKCYSYHARTSTKYMYGCKYAAYNQQF